MTDEVFQLERTSRGTYRIVKQPTSIVRDAYVYRGMLDGERYIISSCTCPENTLERNGEFFLQGTDKCRDDEEFDLYPKDLIILKHWCNACGYEFVCNYSYSLGELK